METNGEIRIYSLRESYRKQYQEMVQQFAIQSFEQGCSEIIPDELSFVEYFSKRELEGKATDNLIITLRIQEEKDGKHFKLILCDENGNALKLE